MPERVRSPVVSASTQELRPPLRDAYLEHLAHGVLTSPVPDFASTLTTQAEQDADEDNLRFLRSELDSPVESASEENDDLVTAPRHDSRTPNLSRHNADYVNQLYQLEERARQVIQEEYHGWAPGATENEADDQSAMTRYSSLYEPGYLVDTEDSGDIVRNRVRWRRLRDHFTSLLGENNPRAQEPPESFLRHHSRFVENGVSSTSPDSSLRTQAMLQAVRQNSEMTPRSRHQLQRFILDRERRGSEPERPERDRDESTTAASNRQLSEYLTRRRQYTTLLRQRDDFENRLRQTDQNHAELENRRPTGTQVPQNPNDGSPIQDAVKYLEILRLCESRKERIALAEESGYTSGASATHNTQDFLLDTASIPPPPKTSWLQIGSVFSGTQHAVPPQSVAYNPSRPLSERSRIRHPIFGVSDARTTSPVPSSRIHPSAQSPSSAQERTQAAPSDFDEKWPVKVTIHAVNYDEMTLAGTMEACEVPDKAAPTRTSNITTYLEGEIIDFNIYTLETKTFEANARVDGGYWRKLPPFKDLSEKTIAKCLLSKQWLEKELMQKWVLMRWKEKSFVTPSEAESALTISGFYYISLQRSDGQIAGLYYDPSSTPYQHLALKPGKRTFPAYDFI